MDAHSTWMSEVGYIPMYPDPKFGAYWEDAIDAGGVGDQGLLEINSNFKIKSSSKDGDTMVFATSPAIVQTGTFPTSSSTSSLAVWNNIFLSPLLGYDENQELVPVLAEDFTVEDGATTFRFNLRDGTAHNGEPITAEDVKWSAEFFQENRDFFPKGARSPYESIDVIDEKTVEFNTTEPFRPLLGRTIPRWGVLPKAMQEFVDDPSSWSGSPPEWVGTGPYQITNFSSGSSIQFEPHDGHPKFEPQSSLLMNSFGSVQGAVRAFENREIDAFTNAPSGALEDLEALDGAKVIRTDGLMEAGLAPQMSFGPTMFREFRMAVSQAIDRDLVVQSAIDGRSTPNVKASIWSENHPWMNADDLPPIADSTSANPDAARSVLEENGWTFDDDGRLHYPEDIDLTPRWPEGSEPAENYDKFPCLEELGVEPAE
jgi:peptide/nickel transport system substrate-binding protein